MHKDFDTWNGFKKDVHARFQTPLYGTREIWWANLGLNVGFEQDGTGSDFDRPVLILRGLSHQVSFIVPLTTSKKRDRFYIDAGLVDEKPAAAIISQLRLIDTRRLVEKIGMLEKATFEVIRKAARDLL